MDLDPEARILSRASGRQQWEGRGLEFKRLCPKSRVSESAYGGRLKTAQGFRVCGKTLDVRHHRTNIRALKNSQSSFISVPKSEIAALMLIARRS
jgi:hypothetical protein